MLPWWTTNNYNETFVCDGWEYLQNTVMWRKDKLGFDYLQDEPMGTFFGVQEFRFFWNFFGIFRSWVKVSCTADGHVEER
jgi:hypothetical protein